MSTFPATYEKPVGCGWVAIALGSNLGQREAHLTAALRDIDGIVDVAATSSVYESAPWGDTAQDPFLNAVVIARHQTDAPTLLGGLKEIERRLGKRVVRQWGPRSIDLDVVFFDEERVDESGLKIPHPRLRDRPFVVEPLREALELEREAPAIWREWSEPSEAARAIATETAISPENTERAVGFGCSFLAKFVGGIHLPTVEATEALGEWLGRRLARGQILALDGPLGAGKTALVRGVARGLGIEGMIQSPSYTLCREHEGGSNRLSHWDFYRLESEGDLESTGFLDEMNRLVSNRSLENPTSGKVFAIEWASRFHGILPPRATVWLTLERRDDDSRTATVRFPAGMLHLRREQEHPDGGRF